MDMEEWSFDGGCLSTNTGPQLGHVEFMAHKKLLICSDDDVYTWHRFWVTAKIRNRRKFPAAQSANVVARKLCTVYLS
jgi:hypothetical protein